ncbi:MAG: hypothetical protein GXP39_16470 [Chloroflexi bacterium]|nr:hypothetical protein [Chloroflexota bacterium]
MPNTNVFTGADGSITLAGPQTDEGSKAQEVVDAYQLTPIGRATDVRVEVTSDIKPFHELGQRYPTELRPGNVNVRGTIGRAYINGALLKLLLGDAATSRPAGSWVQPAFNITLILENPAFPGTRNTITIHEAKFASWGYGIPEDDFVMESVEFQALYISVQDEEGS